MILRVKLKQVKKCNGYMREIHFEDTVVNVSVCVCECAMCGHFLIFFRINNLNPKSMVHIQMKMPMYWVMHICHCTTWVYLAYTIRKHGKISFIGRIHVLLQMSLTWLFTKFRSKLLYLIYYSKFVLSFQFWRQNF